MSLRARILLLVLVATLAPAAMIVAYLFEQRAVEIAEMKQNLSAQATAAASNLDDKINGTVQLLHGLSRAPDLDTADAAACSNFLAQVLARYPQYTGLLTIAPDGELHCDSLRSGRKLNLSGREYFRRALATREPAFETVFGGLTGIAVLQVAYPVFDVLGRPKYVLLASLNLSQFAQRLAAASEYPGFRLLIWSDKAALMARAPEPDGGKKLVGRLYPDSPLYRFVASARSGTASELPDLDGVQRVWALGVPAESQGGGARLTMGVPHESLVAAADAVLQYALISLGAVSLLAFAAAWFLAEFGIRRQIVRISSAAASVGEGATSSRIGPPYPRGELGALMAVVDRSAGAIESQRAALESGSRDLQRANRTLRVLSGINSLIVHAKSRQELFDESCRIAVEVGRFRMSWIGVLDRATMVLEPVSFAGMKAEYAAFIKSQSLAEGSPAAATLTARAIREKSVLYSNDTHRDPAILFKRQHVETGTRSLAILPLQLAGEVAGVMTLYADEPGFFDAAELELLRELARDVSFALEHIENSERLAYLAYYDPVTGLANSTLFHQRLAGFVDAAGNANRGLAVFVLDIERFKAINDSLGREAGDELLRQIAARMIGASGEPSAFARVGADVFAAVAPNAQSEAEAIRLAEDRRAQCFGEPFQVAGQSLKVSARFGAAIFPADGADAATLFRNAEAALKKAKAGGERFLFYTQKMTERMAENLALENRLRHALEHDEFVLHYQPKVDLGSRRVVGVEALIRWQDPQSGLVPPLKFVPLLEETGLILQVGDWALRRATRDHCEWTAKGLKAPSIAVNVSPIQLRQRDFVATVQAATQYGGKRAGIDLEITENLIMQDVDATIDKLNALRALGMRIAIDDFGTGYSSLAYLARLPVESIKIDRSFIIRMLEDTNTMTLVQTMISLAHSLRLKVVAEGVETEEQARVLRLLRCDQMQGYLFSKPLPLAAITALLAAEASKDNSGVRLRMG